jgi:DNA-damage-inducible protein J
MGSRTEEVKSYVEPQIKAETSDIYAHLGLSLSDAVNVFLIKSIEVGGLPLDMRPEPKHCYAQSNVPPCRVSSSAPTRRSASKRVRSVRSCWLVARRSDLRSKFRPHWSGLLDGRVRIGSARHAGESPALF